MKLIKYLTIFILFNCQTDKSNPELTFNRAQLNESIKADKGVIISCFRCSCIDHFTDKIIQQNIQVPLFGDSRCISRDNSMDRHLIQKIIDSVFESSHNRELFTN